jgi:hypothetical protein
MSGCSGVSCRLCRCGSLLVTASSDWPRAEQPRKCGLVPSNCQGFFLFSKASARPSVLRVTGVSFPKVKPEVAWNWLYLYLLPRLRMGGAVSPFPGTPPCTQEQLTFILWSVWRRYRRLSNWASKLRLIDECWKTVAIARSFLTYTHYLERLRNITTNMSGRLVSDSRLEPGSLGVSARHHVWIYSYSGRVGTAHSSYCTPQHPLPQGWSVFFTTLCFDRRSNLTPVVTGPEFERVMWNR